MTIPHPAQDGYGHTALPKPRWRQRIDHAKARKAGPMMEAPPPQPTVGDFLGLCLPVAFAGVPASFTQGEIEAFCNQPGYSGFGNKGSVYDYYADNSLGKVRYNTVVAPCYTAARPRDYYTDEAIPFGQRSAQLVSEAVAWHLAQGLDFSRLTLDGSHGVRATNLLYAGGVVNQPNVGLWPHASTVPGGAPAGGGRLVADYQVSAMADALSLGVYCHENGHMLCDFPDLYQGSKGCGAYCLMSFGAVADRFNPPQVGAYLKYKAGWGSPVVVQAGKRYLATAGSNSSFMLQKSATEYFLIEYRQRQGRDAALPAAGLAVWHVDELGSNPAPATAPAGHQHFECTLLRAGGQDELLWYGEAGDLFGPAAQPVFTDTGRPSTRWWDNSRSGLQISGIKPMGSGLEFTVA